MLVHRLFATMDRSGRGREVSSALPTMDSRCSPLFPETKGRDGQLGHGHTGGHHGQSMVSPVPWDKGAGRTDCTRPPSYVVGVPPSLTCSAGAAEVEIQTQVYSDNRGIFGQ